MPIKPVTYKFCALCNKHIETRRFPAHIYKHTQEKPFVCRHCEKEFAEKGNRKKHIAKVHYGFKFTCVECKAEFNNQSLLTRHKKRKNKFPNRCKFCCMSYKSKSWLVNHVKNKHKVIQVDKEKGVANPSRSMNEEIDNYESDEDFMPKTGLVKSTNVSPPTLSSKKVTFKQNGPPRKQARINGSNVQSQHVVGASDDEDTNDVNDEDERGEYNDSQAMFPYIPGPSTIQPVATEMPIPPLSAALNEQYLNRTLNEDSDTNFDILVLKTWMLDSTYCNDELVFYTTMGSELGSNVMGYLGETKICESVNELLVFLSHSPHDNIGIFTIAALVIEILVKFSPEGLIDLLQDMHALNNEYKRLINCSALYLLQHYVQLDCSDNLISKIPLGLLENLSIDYLSLAMIDEDRKLFVTNQQAMLSSSLHTCLVDFMVADGCGDNVLLFDGCMQYERFSKWTVLIDTMIKELTLKGRKSAFQILLKLDNDKAINTKSFAYIKTGSKLISLNIHSKIFSKFTDYSPETVENVEATEMDLNAFLDLVYFHFDEGKQRGKVTLGLYRIAQHLKISDIANFLFRGYSYKSFMGNENKLDLLAILINLKDEESVNEMAETFSSWVPEGVTTFFNELSYQDFVYFFGNAKLKIDGLFLYKVIIQWSCCKANELCNDELKIPYNEIVYSYFNSVIVEVPAFQLQNYYRQLLPLHYLKSTHIAAARRKSLDIKK